VRLLPKCFPSNRGGWIESDPDTATGCCPLKSEPGSAWNAPGPHGDGWKALSFSIQEPRFYKYRFKGGCCEGRDCSRATFTAQAIGDLNCDGVTAANCRSAGA